MVKKRIELDCEQEREKFRAACMRPGVGFQQIVHALCTAEEIQSAQLLNPISGFSMLVWSLLLVCGLDWRCGRRPEVARALGLKCSELSEAVRKAHTFLDERPRRVAAWAMRKARLNLEAGAIGCEVVVLGQEVFGLPRKRDRSRLLSRRLCRYVAEKVAQLSGDEGLYRGWRLIGQIWDSRPNARKTLIEKSMRYLVLLVAEGEGPRDDRIKGILMLSKEKEGIAISNFYIEPEFRGHGWGRRMLEALLRKYKEDGVLSEYLRLEVNTANEAACRLYRSVGFKDWKTTMEMEFDEEE